MSIAVHGGVRIGAGKCVPPRILVVDDESDIRDPMAQFLSVRGLGVDTASNGTALREQLKRETYDLVLLDVMMPGEDGLSLCREIRQFDGPPVILLSALGEITDRVRGLDAGADDYVVKPFDPSELLARIRSVLRRAERLSLRDHAPARPMSYRFAHWTLNLAHAELVHDDGRVMALSAAETRLLHAFVVRPQEVLSRERLLDLCANDEADIFDRSIDSQISRLRRKVEDDPRRPRILKTAWGEGYMLASFVGQVA